MKVSYQLIAPPPVGVAAKDLEHGKVYKLVGVAISRSRLFFATMDGNVVALDNGEVYPAHRFNMYEELDVELIVKGTV